jgi:DNA-binding transcriptional regulator PaaX
VAVDRLVGEGHLVADRGGRSGYRIVDPFLGAWLRGE